VYIYSHVKPKGHPILWSKPFYGFIYQDVIKKSSGPWKVLKLIDYNLRWTTTHDILHHAIIYL